MRELPPPEAHEAMTNEDGVVYLDVRTAHEFEQGHPPGAYNVPVVLLDPAGGPAQPNSEFLAVVEAHLPKDTKLLVGCLSGGRSQRACRILAEAGYVDLTNVQGGFGGSRDRTGRVIVVGWRDAGLPVESGQPSGRSYAELLQRCG
jgi:rhodanese-related sulfurtransferase